MQWWFLLVLSLFLIVFVRGWSSSDIPGHHVMSVMSENEVNHVLERIKLKKYHDVQAMIQNNPTVLREIRNVLGEDYVFQDYMLSLEKSAISTCHRDENGQMFNDSLKHPVYTVLFYFEPMEACLDVIDGSHKTRNFFNFKGVRSISCTPGQAILFNADLIHSGSINARDNNRRIQMKLIHKEDVGKVPEFDGYHKVADASKTNARWYTTFVRDVSCTLTGVSDVTENGRRVPKWIQNAYKTVAYGGEDKYTLTDF